MTKPPAAAHAAAKRMFRSKRYGALHQPGKLYRGARVAGVNSAGSAGANYVSRPPVACEPQQFLVANRDVDSKGCAPPWENNFGIPVIHELAAKCNPKLGIFLRLQRVKTAGYTRKDCKINLLRAPQRGSCRVNSSKGRRALARSLEMKTECQGRARRHQQSGRPPGRLRPPTFQQFVLELCLSNTSRGHTAMPRQFSSLRVFFVDCHAGDAWKRHVYRRENRKFHRLFPRRRCDTDL
jgi:hypothetical protein